MKKFLGFGLETGGIVIGASYLFAAMVWNFYSGIVMVSEIHYYNRYTCRATDMDGNCVHYPGEEKYKDILFQVLMLTVGLVCVFISYLSIKAVESRNSRRLIPMMCMIGILFASALFFTIYPLVKYGLPLFSDLRYDLLIPVLTILIWIVYSFFGILSNYRKFK